MGISLGHIGADALGLTTLVGVVTIALSTYMILYAQPLYERLSPWLGLFERRRPVRELAVERQRQPDTPPRVIVFGLGRYGERLLSRLHDNGVVAMGVDFDPETVRRLRQRGLAVRFGDAEDAAFLETLPLARCDWLVTTLPTWEANRVWLHALKVLGVPGCITGVVGDERHGRDLRAAGAARVINPFHDAADHAAQTITDSLVDIQEPSP